MKIITLLALLIAVGCILATGCVAQPKKDPGNATASPTTTFTPFVNATTAPVTNVTNATGLNNTSGLSGPLRISIGNYNPGRPLPVFIDNQSAGNVTLAKPLDLMLSEGNHVVKICVGVICPTQQVGIVFAKSSYLEFGDILRKEAEFPVTHRPDDQLF